jgi:hypothetical protein
MPVLTGQPANINFLSPLGFRFKLDRTPNLNFFVTDVVLPSISLSSVDVPSPFKMIEIAGSKLDYGDLQITFRMDEDFETYFEMYNWLTAIGFPESFSQYAPLKNAPPGSSKTVYSDATLTILNSGLLPNININFINLFPTSISEMSFTALETDVNYISMTATFKYQIFHVTKLPSYQSGISGVSY